MKEDTSLFLGSLAAGDTGRMHRAAYSGPAWRWCDVRREAAERGWPPAHPDPFPFFLGLVSECLVLSHPASVPLRHLLSRMQWEYPRSGHF